MQKHAGIIHLGVLYILMMMMMMMMMITDTTTLYHGFGQN